VHRIAVSCSTSRQANGGNCYAQKPQPSTGNYEMNPLIESVMGALDQRTVSLMSSQLGTSPGQTSGASPFARMLDSDGDGDLDMNDIARHGRSLLGGFFKR